MVRVAINGLGRIGRSVLKICLERGIDVVAINDLTECKNLAYLLAHDSVYGKWNKKIEAGRDFLKINGKKIIVTKEKDPASLPWKKLGVNVVIESTGSFTSRQGAGEHIIAGAKKVLVSAPCSDKVVTIVPGVNHQSIKKTDDIISVTSCTTNCLAPIAKVLEDNFGLLKGFLTTIHAYTSDQRLHDASHNDLRRGRAAAENLVPTTTGATHAVELVLPSLKGKLAGLAIRAPVICGSIVDFVAELKKKTNAAEINKTLQKAAEGKLKGILQYSEDALVSRDIIGNPHSSIVDGLSTQVINDDLKNGSLAKIIAWYDNEYGYACRMVDVIQIVKKLM